MTLNKISEYSMTDADVTSIMSGKTLQDGTAITTTALLRDYVEENLRLNQVSSDVQQYFLDNMKVKKDITDLVDMNLQTNLNYVKQEAAAYDMDLETFVQTYSNYSSSEEYSESLRSDAEDGIKLSLAAQYLAEEQGYKPTEDDVRAYVGTNYDYAAETYGKGPLAQECLYNKIMGRYCLDVYERSVAEASK